MASGFWIIALMSLAAASCQNCLQLSSNISALVLFGDSILDTGNNNYLNTLAKADHYPYGIDFPQKRATGRWSNGLIISDMLAELLGFDTPLPYLDPSATGPAILRGINMATGGSGLINHSEDLKIASLSTQLTWFANYRNQLEQLLGANKTASVLASALYVISAGTNDYIIDYYSKPAMQARYSVSEFRAMLLQNYQNDLKELYAAGGRNVGLLGIGVMGCLPIVRTVVFLTDGKGCSEELNAEAQAFNEGLQSLVSTLVSGLDGFKLVYIDAFHLGFQIIQRPQDYGFTVTGQSCCGGGNGAIGATCRYLSAACTNRDDYVFFDGIHPTQRSYQIAINTLFRGSLNLGF